MLAYVGPSWGYVGPSWTHLRARLAHLGAMLAHLAAYVGPCWPIFSHKKWEKLRTAKNTVKRESFWRHGVPPGVRRQGAQPLSPSERREGLRQGHGHHSPRRAPGRTCWGDRGERLGAIWAHLGARLAYVGPSWGHVGLAWGQCGPILGLCWPMLAHLGAMLAHLGPILGLGWPILGLCWPILRPMLAPVGPSRATWSQKWENTETAKNTGLFDGGVVGSRGGGPSLLRRGEKAYGDATASSGPGGPLAGF